MRINKLKLNTFIVIILVLVSKILSFLRDILVSKNFGVGFKTDAYNIVYLVIITTFGVVGSALTNAIMPSLTELYVKDKNKFESSANSLITGTSIITIIITIFMLIQPTFFIKIFVGKIDSKTIELSEVLLMYCAISLVFLALNSIINSILRIYNYVIIPTISNLLFPLPGIIAMFFWGNNIVILTISLTIGYAIQLLFQVIFLMYKKFKFKVIFKFKENGIIRILKLMPPMILSSGVLQISTIFDNRVVSKFGEGSITALSLASKVNAIFFTVFATASMQVIFAILAKAFVEKNENDFKKTLSEQGTFIMTLIVPAMIVMTVMSKEIIEVLFYRGNFTLDDVNVTASILTCFSLGLVFYVLRDICNYAFFARGDSKTPCNISIFVVIINIINNYILSSFIGIEGVALATSISGILSFVLLYNKLVKLIGSVTIINRNTFIKISISSVMMIISIYMLTNFTFNGCLWKIIKMIISVSVYFITYFLQNRVSIRKKDVKGQKLWELN